MSQAEWLQQLEALERLLHDPEVRLDRDRLGALLHPQFVEFGRSGRVWKRQAVLDELAGAQAAHAAPVTIHAEHFELHAVADDAALLTYRSAHRQVDGRLSRWTLRSSLWQRVGSAWTMRFHQGTAFEPLQEQA